MPKENTKSVLMEGKDETISTPDYSKEERDYIGKLQLKLEDAKEPHDAPHDEFDGLTLQEYADVNEKEANTMLKAKKNREDVSYQSGTLRNKLMAFVSTIVGLNLSPDIIAHTKNDIQVTALGDAMEDIVDKTNEMDGDEEKKMLRAYEILKQGTVFVEEIWEEKYITEKEIDSPFSGVIKAVNWTVKKVKQICRPTRNILSLTAVYLGDIRQYFIKDQPFIFTLEDIPYSTAEQIYSKWERWKYVSRDKRSFQGTDDDSMVNNTWRFGGCKKDRVQVIKYQDKPNNEYQIILNGVIMLPMGFPFPWGYNEYNVSQQNLAPHRKDFAYGKSFVFKNKNIINILDQMTRLALLKTQKSFMPPYLNTSGRIISSRVLMPGKISMGIQKDQLTPISDKEVQGVTNSEFNMMEYVNRVVDSNTSSATFSGSKEKGQVTATQIIELQRQAKIMMGVTNLSMSLMEEKISVLRLLNILQKWFDPIDDTVDKARDMLVNRYRIVSRKRSISDKGMGIRMVVPTDELPDVNELKDTEDKMSKRLGSPVGIIALNPNQIKQMDYIWTVKVSAKDKKSSEMSKLMFRAMMEDALALGLPLKPEWVQEEFAVTWEKNPSKMFEKGQQVSQEMPPAPPSATPNRVNTPQVTAKPEVGE